MVDQVNNIVRAGNAGDWRASAWLAEHHEATKADYGKDSYGDEPVKVILQIERGD